MSGGDASAIPRLAVDFRNRRLFMLSSLVAEGPCPGYRFAHPGYTCSHDVARMSVATCGDARKLDHCRTPLRSIPSSQDTVAYITMARVESTSTATQTSAMS